MQHGHYAVDLLFPRQGFGTPSSSAIELMNMTAPHDEKITKALEQMSDLNTKVSTVVMQENWHKGVVGIVASRLIESHYRPTVVLTASEDTLVGSVRW